MLCLFIYAAHSQNELSGQIIDKTSNSALEAVNVYIPQLEIGTFSDRNGNFDLTGIPNGSYQLVISYLGYKTQSVNIQIPTQEALIIALQPSAIEMESIIISTPFHKLQSENVMKVEQEDIADLRSRGAVNLSDGISNIAGVENLTTGMGIGKPVIRGLSSNRVVVYTQNVRLENQQFGAEHGLGVSEFGNESVEIIKGPASLLYGSDALGGVLYINPEKFAPSRTSEINLASNYFGNTNGFNTSLGLKQSDEKFKFLFRGSMAQHADYDTENYRVTNSRFTERDFKAGVGYQANCFRSELRYNVNASKLGIPEEIGEQSKLITPLLPFQELTNHILSSKSTVFFKDSKLDFNIGLSYNERKEFEEHHHEEDNHDEEHEEEEEHEDEEHKDEEHEDEEILEAALHMKLKTLNYNVKYTLPKLGKFETIVGVQGMTQSNGNYGEETLIPDANTNDIGFLAASHIHFDKLDVQLGFRFDNRTIKDNISIDKNFNSFNGAIGFKTNLLQNVVARLNLASGFRAPNLAELASEGTHNGANRYEIGNLDLKSEQNFQTDLSLEYENEHVEIFANGFYNHITDYIFASPNGTFVEDDPVFIYTQDNAKLYGGEFGLHFHPHPLDWLHFESSFEMVTGEQDNGDYLPLIPANSLTNTLRAEYETKWLERAYFFVTYRSYFEQKKVSRYETPNDAYNLLSTGLGGTLNVFDKELNVYLSVTNLTNESYISHLSRLKTDGIFNMGRSINAGLDFSF